ncbi:MAG: hypothetical protein HKO02_09880 [Hyphomonadaceae bacterium]|nr:hypothetical protein [Hyphomonadaceae bacterium]
MNTEKSSEKREVLSKQEARAGVEVKGMRTVLVVSLILAVVVIGAVFISFAA